MSLTHRIDPGSKVDLAKFDPDDDCGLSKDDAEDRLKDLGKRLSDLQELLYAAGQHALLIVLQGRDTAGKDGTIRHLLTLMNAQGTAIAPFKVPTPREIGHDFLWRVHQVTPMKGESVIFNRSHYEDVLVVRVHELVPKDVWSKRFAHINAFEQLLVDSNTIVLKFMLHISKEEQEQRLLEREQETEKAWKLSVTDWKERDLWEAYTKAYEDVLAKCSTDIAPWHLVPANKKWFRNLAITEAIVEALEPLEKGWMQRLRDIGDRAKADLAAYRSEPIA